MRKQRVTRWGTARLMAGALLCVGSLACSLAVEPQDPRVCPRTGEFGNTGCIEITGQVVSLSGKPLAGIEVGPQFVPGREVFNSDFTTTDSTGTFAFRLSRFGGVPPAVGPDTVSLWVRGVDPWSAPLISPARVRDSVLVQATVSPVGTLPTPTIVRLTLPTP